MITLRVIDKPGARGRTSRYKTLTAARRKAAALVGSTPRLDPDGYAVGPFGDCLFFDGCTFVELFPETHWSPQ